MLKVLLAVPWLAAVVAEPATCDTLTCPEGYQEIKAHMYGGNKCSQQALTTGGVAGDEKALHDGCISIAGCGWEDGECFADKCREQTSSETCLATMDNAGNACMFDEAGWVCHKDCTKSACQAVRATSTLKCAGATCTLADDLHTCCNAAQCGKFQCPEAHFPKAGVEDTLCTALDGVPTCGEDDIDTCCDPRDVCENLDCGGGYTLMTDGQHVSEKLCLAATCALADDRDTCCDPLATCDTFECPKHSTTDMGDGTVMKRDFVSRPNPDQIFCKGKECDDSHDRDTCCEMRMECSEWTCPDGWSPSDHAHATMIACAGGQCDDVTDADADGVADDVAKCCHPTVPCDESACPEGFVLRDGAAGIMCKSGSALGCDFRVDRDTCCDQQETCDEMMKVLYPCGDINLQHDSECDGQCVKALCEAQPQCAFGYGPPEMPWIPYKPTGHLGDPANDADDQPIGAGACGWAECHREWGACACPHAEDQWGEDEQLRGPYFSPDMATNAAAWGWTGDATAFAGACADVELYNGEMGIPMSGVRHSEKCGEDFAAKPEATTTFCQKGHCTVEDDHDTCCTERAACHTLAPPTGFALKEAAHDIQCLSHTCTEEADLATCADARAPCSDMTCPQGMQVKAEEGLLCAGGTCDELVDKDACCDDCAPGTFSAEAGEACTECEVGKYSAMGFGGVGSLSCRHCDAGKFSHAGQDHCHDCQPIFACAKKSGMQVDTGADVQQAPEFVQREYNTAGCMDAVLFNGEVDSEARCKVAAEALGMEFPADGSNKVENGPANCYTDRHGTTAFFARHSSVGFADPTLAPICRNGLDALLPSTGAGAVTCSSLEDAVCDECYFGFWGDRTSRCVKCTAVENCEYPIGHPQGTLCTNPTDPKCGTCKEGFYGPTCEACSAIPGCAEGGVTCTNSNDSKCATCSGGFYSSSDAECTPCASIEHCFESSCTGPSDHQCHACDTRFYPSGAQCSPVVYDQYLNIFTYQVADSVLAAIGGLEEDGACAKFRHFDCTLHHEVDDLEAKVRGGGLGGIKAAEALPSLAAKALLKESAFSKKAKNYECTEQADIALSRCFSKLL